MTEPYYTYEVPAEPLVSKPSNREANPPRAPGRFFVAGRPVVWSHSFTGRASTGYICYDVATGGVHFMKDAWRAATACVDEPSIYRRLNKHCPDLGGDPDDGEEDFFEPADRPTESGGSLSDIVATAPGEPFAVPHVATMLCGGDVYYADDRTTPQTTRLHGDNSGNRKPMQEYIHFRMVLKDVGEPLEKFESVPDLLQVISDVVVGM